MESTLIQSNAIGLTLDTPIDFALSDRLSDVKLQKIMCKGIRVHLEETK